MRCLRWDTLSTADTSKPHILHSLIWVRCCPNWHPTLDLSLYTAWSSLFMSDPNAIIQPDELHLMERIGRGSFGDVYRAYWRHTEVAVKKIPDLNTTLYEELFEEARLMMYHLLYPSAPTNTHTACSNLRHPNVVQFMGVCTTMPDVALVTEYIHRGSLYSVIHDENTVLYDISEDTYSHVHTRARTHTLEHSQRETSAFLRLRLDTTNTSVNLLSTRAGAWPISTAHRLFTETSRAITSSLTNTGPSRVRVKSRKLLDGKTIYPSSMRFWTLEGHGPDRVNHDCMWYAVFTTTTILSHSLRNSVLDGS